MLRAKITHQQQVCRQSHETPTHTHAVTHTHTHTTNKHTHTHRKARHLVTEQGIDGVRGGNELSHTTQVGLLIPPPPSIADAASVGIVCGDGARGVSLHQAGCGGVGASFFRRGVTQFVAELPRHLAAVRRLRLIGVEAHGKGQRHALLRGEGMEQVEWCGQKRKGKVSALRSLLHACNARLHIYRHIFTSPTDLQV